MIQQIREQHPEETPEQHQIRLKYRQKHLNKRQWPIKKYALLMLLSALMFSAGKLAHCQTSNVDITRVGGTAVTGPNLPTDPQGPDAQGAAQTGKPLQNGGRYYTDGTVRTIATDTNGDQLMSIIGTVTMALPAQPFLNTTDFTDVTASSPTRGDIITAQGATPKYTRLGVGGANTLLHGGTEPSYSAVAQGDVTGGYLTMDATAQSVTGVKTWSVNANLFSINGGIFMADQYSGATGKLKIENCMLTNGGYRFCIAPMGLDASSAIAAATAPANSYVLDMRGAATVQTGQNCMYCFWGGPNGGGAARWFYGFAANRANDFPFSRMFIYNELTTTEWGGGYPLGADLALLARGAADLHLVNDASSTTQVATTSVTLATTTSVAVTSTANFPDPNTSLWGVAPNYGTLTVSDSNGANIEFLAGVVGSPCNLALVTVNGTYCKQDATHFIIRTAISHTQPYNISQQGRMYLDVGRMACNAKAFAGDTQKRPCYFTDSGASLNATLAIPSDTSATWPFSGIGHGVALTGTDATGAHNNLLLRNNTSADSSTFQTSGGSTIASAADAGMTFTLPADKTGSADIVADSGAINTTETVIVKTPALAASRLVAGSHIRITLTGICTSTAANVSTFTLRWGTNGTTADGTVAALASSVAAVSGTANGFRAIIDLTVRTGGATASSAAFMELASDGNIGIVATPNEKFVAGTAFNTTTASGILSLAYKSAATTTTSTFKNATIEIVYQ